MSDESGTGPLRRLARLHGIQTAYYDVLRRRRRASDDALLEMLKALGAPLQTAADASNAVRDYHQSLWSQPLEPVTVVWDSQPASMHIRLPLDFNSKRITGRLTLENGERRQLQWTLASLPTVGAVDVEGRSYVIKRAILSENLPWGYHNLDIELEGRTYQALIISAPKKAYSPPQKGKNWGIFAPLYSLHSQNSWGIGDYSDLERFMSQGARLGSRLISTLPLLPLFDDEPSPYRPLSRLFWNELYIDINAIPELAGCEEAQAILSSQTFLRDLEKVRQSQTVDYKNVMQLKRRVLKVLCRYIFSNQSDRLQQLLAFARQNPQAEDYARFRAVCDTQDRPWQQWPVSLRDGAISDGDYDEHVRRYHLYAQWLATEQVSRLYDRAKQINNSLYLDLPLGVHPDGYDAWRYHDSFIQNVSAGAPPDVMFTSGQNWGFAPLHPEAIRHSGYGYIRAYLHHQMSCAGIVRLDHVMGLHRIFCVPGGMTSELGVYLRYHNDEMYAILCLESNRSKTMVVGEDLGTVPNYVRPAMAKHRFLRMYVLNYEMESSVSQPLHAVRRNCVASVNTHDMFPFASYWQSIDIEERLKLGFVKPDAVDTERGLRQTAKHNLAAFFERNGYLKNADPETIDIIKACLAYLSESDARAVLVNVEDLWQETEPQNVPGTNTERPNWRKKLPFSLEQIASMPQVTQMLEMVNRIRKEGSGG